MSNCRELKQAQTEMSKRISELVDTVKDLKNEMSEVSKSLEGCNLSTDSVNDTVTRIEVRLNKIDDFIGNTDHKYNELSKKYEDLNERIIAMENYSKRDNLIIDGIPEAADGEKEMQSDCIKKVQHFLENSLKLRNAKQMKITRCYRLGVLPSTKSGSRPSGRSRAILFQLLNNTDRQLIWEQKKLLKNTDFHLREDFCKETMDRRKILVPIMHAAWKQNLIAFLVNDKLHTIDKDTQVKNIYDHKTLHRLPKSLNPDFVTTEQSEDVFAFFGSLCPLSNFHNSPFQIGQENYRWMEEFLFARKAEFANDEVARQKIRDAKTPAECKWIGRNIKVDYKKWNPQEIQVMTKGLHEKFSQNKNLKEYLLNTGKKTLVEASPSDRFWGSGAGLGKANTLVGWNGKNKLGELLMTLREQFK